MTEAEKNLAQVAEQSTNMQSVTGNPVDQVMGAFAPKTLDEALRLAEILSKSTIVPKDYQGNPGNVLVAIQWGAELGLPPLQAMQNIAVINGRPSLWGDAVLALVQACPAFEWIDEQVCDTQATCRLKRKGKPEVERSFSLDDAKRAGLLSKQGPWTTYPKRMMQMRARSWACRDLFADVLRGMNVAEEAQDFETESPALERPKPASRTEELKQRMSQQRPAEPTPPPAEPSPEEQHLQQLLEAINQAESLEGLHALAEGVADLEKGSTGRGAAVAAMKARKAKLEAAQ